MSEVYIYILVMALTSFAIRVLPLTLIQTEIKNPLIKSFFMVHDNLYPFGSRIRL